jgi:hypothetical protein
LEQSSLRERAREREREREKVDEEMAGLMFQVLSFLVLLVQKYKY